MKHRLDQARRSLADSHALHERRAVRAFSLIEILIAVVVLAIGLLGLAAVFPAVIKQQQTATDAVLGMSAARSAEVSLKGIGALREGNEFWIRGNNPAAIAADRRGWQNLTGRLEWSRFDVTMDNHGPWVIPETTGNVPGHSGSIAIDPDTGDMVFGTPGALEPVTNRRLNGMIFPVRARLIPSPHSGQGEPRYVWDIVTQRIGAPGQVNESVYDSVRVAIFVRRIDAAIRVPAGRTLSDVFVGNDGLPPANRRVPVGAEVNGRPTYDGLGAGSNRNYSLPMIADIAAISPAEPDMIRIVLSTLPGYAPAELLGFARQVGQKLLDQYGVVHTVTKVIDRNPADDMVINPPILKVDPPMNPLIVARSNNNLPVYIVFTPQTPAAILVPGVYSTR